MRATVFGFSSHDKSGKSEKIKYRKDLELSEYVRSFLLAFVEAELLAVEVRVFKAFIFYFFNCGP